MKKRGISILLTVAISGGLLWLAGCQNESQTDALIGGAVGAGVGQAIGRNTEGTLLGAAAGAGLGYVWGNEQEKKKAAQQQAAQQAVPPPPIPQQPSGNSETVWITNSNGSKTAVVIRQEGGYWYGPKGERYTEKPTEEQLKQVYGF